MQIARIPNHAPLSPSEKAKQDKRIWSAIKQGMTRSAIKRMYRYTDREIDAVAEAKGIAVTEAPKKKGGTR